MAHKGPEAGANQVANRALPTMRQELLRLLTLLDGPSTRPLGGQTRGVLPLDGRSLGWCLVDERRASVQVQGPPETSAKP